MRHLPIAHPSRQSLHFCRDASLKGVYLGATSANDVMMMMLFDVELIPIRSIAKIASLHKFQLFEDGKIAIYRREIAGSLFQTFVNLLDGERSVIRSESLQYLAPLPGDSILAFAQGIENPLRYH